MSPIVSPRRSHEHSHRPVLKALSGYGDPSRLRRDEHDVAEPDRPTLRIVADERHEAAPDHAAPVLLVGADARRRALLRVELGATLPPRTPFLEADDVSEVLECATSSRMVILAGDLDDADAGSLMRLLGARHPLLPVICVEELMPAAAAGGRG